MSHQPCVKEEEESFANFHIKYEEQDFEDIPTFKINEMIQRSSDDNAIENTSQQVSDSTIIKESLQEALNLIFASSASMADFESVLMQNNGALNLDHSIPDDNVSQTDNVSTHNEAAGSSSPNPTPSFEEKPYACLLCDYASKLKRNLVTHMRKHTGEKPFRCSLCDYCCKQKTQLANHMKAHKNKRNKMVSLWSGIYNTTNTSSSDRDTPNSVEETFHCKHCKYSSKRKEDFLAHTCYAGKRVFECTICDYVSKQKSNLDTHMRTHTGAKPFRCNQCSYSAKQHTQLKNHLKTHLKSKTRQNIVGITPTLDVHPLFVCSICCSQFKYKGSLSTHLKTHSREKPHRCGLCDYASHQKGNLVTHMRKHTGEKPFHCDKCDYSAKQRTQLVNHLKTHRKKDDLNVELEYPIDL